MMRLFLSIIFLWPLLLLSAVESWKVTGIVDAINRDDSTITLRHEGVSGFATEPGILSVSIGNGDIAIAKVGTSIRGTLVQREDVLSLENIWPADKTTERSMMMINRDLTRPRIGSSSKGMLKVGDELPRFALYNQKGELVTPDDLENKAVVLNFIFTRSGVPSMSPATTDRMAELQDRLADAGLADSVCLLSLSLDPEFDTPGICYDYLQKRDIDHDSYWLLTGSKKTLEFLTKKIGVVSAPSVKTIINHSMVVLIVDREGKIFHRIPGTRWKLDDVYNRLEVMLKTWN